MSNTEKLISMFTNLCLASYLSNKPDHQIRRMAQKYYKQTSDKRNKATFKMIYESKYPAVTVRVALHKILEIHR